MNMLVENKNFTQEVSFLIVCLVKNGDFGEGHVVFIVCCLPYFIMKYNLMSKNKLYILKSVLLNMSDKMSKIYQTRIILWASKK